MFHHNLKYEAASLPHQNMKRINELVKYGFEMKEEIITILIILLNS